MVFPLKLLLYALFIGLGSYSSDNDKATKMPDKVFKASFRLSGDGYNEIISYNNENNLIFAKLIGDELWIRLAQNKASNGDHVPHIDIDVCNYAGAGTYYPTDPRKRPCPEGNLWDIWWHDGDKVYMNKPSASPCQLILTLEQDVLHGTFSCDELIRFKGNGETIQVLEGSFSCRIE